MADLLVRGVDDDLVQALKKRAGAHGRSQEAELRVILASVLLSPPRSNLAELLADMPELVWTPIFSDRLLHLDGDNFASCGVRLLNPFQAC